MQSNGTSAACLACGAGKLVPFRSQRQWHIVRCTRCDHRQLSPRPTREELTALYSTSYFQGGNSGVAGYSDYLGNELGWRRTARARLRRLRRIATGTRLLDVGAACGFFVDEARNGLLDARGVELSPWASQWARHRLGVNVITGTLADLSPSSSFDIVCAWEVIEHVPDPGQFIEDALAHLSSNGFLALSTPDCAALVPRLLGRRWLGWSKVPEHISFFTQRSVRTLLSRWQLRIVSLRYVSTHITLSYLADRLAVQAFGHSLGPLELGNLTLPINPGWDLEVIACRS